MLHCLTNTPFGCPATIQVVRQVRCRLTASVPTLRWRQSTAVPAESPSAVDPPWKFLRVRILRVVAPSTTRGRPRIDQDNQAQASLSLPWSRGLRKGARVHAAKKTAPEEDAVSHHCRARRRAVVESHP